MNFFRKVVFFRYLLLITGLLLLNSAILAQRQNEERVEFTKCAQINFEGNIKSSNASDNEIAILTDKNEIYIFDTEQNRTYKVTDLLNKIISNLLIYNDHLVYVSTNENTYNLNVIDKNTGILKHNLKIGNQDNENYDKKIGITIDAANKYLKIITPKQNKLFDLDKFQVLNNEININLSNSYINTYKNSVSKYISKTKIWEFKTGGQITSSIQSDENIYITSLDNFLYCLSTNGKVIWKRRFSARLTEKPLINNKYIAVEVMGDNKIFILSTISGNVISYIDSNQPKLIGITSEKLIIYSEKNLQIFEIGQCKKEKDTKVSFSFPEK